MAIVKECPEKRKIALNAFQKSCQEVPQDGCSICVLRGVQGGPRSGHPQSQRNAKNPSLVTLSLASFHIVASRVLRFLDLACLFPRVLAFWFCFASFDFRQCALDMRRSSFRAFFAAFEMVCAYCGSFSFVSVSKRCPRKR